MSHVGVVGAGMGGLSAALALARLGHRVTLCEARHQAGGLAGRETHEGLSFDIGPYLLLDKPGLAIAFEWLGLDLEAEVALTRVEEICEIGGGSGPPVRFYGDLERTAAGFEATWPGSGPRYQALVRSIHRTYERLAPLLFEPVPRAAVWRNPRAWPALPFLLQPLGKVLGSTGLPRPLVEAIGIWAHFVGQPVDRAPSPMGFAPLFLHEQGAFYAPGGIGGVPAALERAARGVGVEIRLGAAVRAIVCEGGTVRALELDTDERIEVDAVVCNHGGVGVHRLVRGAATPRSERRVEGLRLQSPGACAWLAIEGPPPETYLRFHRPDAAPCAVLVQPRRVDPTCGREGVYPARLIAPIDHAEAALLGPEGQLAWFQERLAEGWWGQEGMRARVLAVRTPARWGADFHLPQDAMNPAMTAEFMRQGRMSTRNPDVRGLYLAGSATHPGQFVAFCAQSGVHAARRLHADL
jgi:phytoene dehydrogenase-like protein